MVQDGTSLDGTGWCLSIGSDGSGYFMILDGARWYWMELDGTGWY